MASPKEGNMDNSVAQLESAEASASTQSLRRSLRNSNQVISPNQNKHESSKTRPAKHDETSEGDLKSNNQEKHDTSKTQSASSNPKEHVVDNDKDLVITDDVSFNSSGCNLFGESLSEHSVLSNHDKNSDVTVKLTSDIIAPSELQPPVVVTADLPNELQVEVSITDNNLSAVQIPKRKKTNNNTGSMLPNEGSTQVTEMMSNISNDAVSTTQNKDVVSGQPTATNSLTDKNSTKKKKHSNKDSTLSNKGGTQQIDKEKVSKPNAAVSLKPMPIFSSASEGIHTISIGMLTMLIHSTPECLVCQPKANYRTLQLGNLKEKNFIHAMTETGEDVMEEMYGFLYELTTVEGAGTVPIYTAYTTSSDQDDFIQLPNLFAKYPTDSSLKQMAKSFNIKREYSTESAALVSDIFNDIIGQQDYFMKKVFTTTVDYRDTKKTVLAKGIAKHTNYSQLRTVFQNDHPIRIAILGGLHRTALALHILGNYSVQNSKPTPQVKPLYKLTEDSPITSAIAIHIFSSNNQQLSDEFLSMSRTFSEQVNDRRKKGVEITVAGQMWDLLKNKSTMEMNKHRFLPADLLRTKMVSSDIDKN